MLKRMTLIALLAATTITGCANSDVYSGDVYTKDRAKQVQTVSYGTIISTRPVKIQADENSLVGTIGGAVVGGLLGSTVGGGTGRDVAMVLGSIGGAVAGQAIQQRYDKPVQGQQIIVRTTSGVLVSISQPTNPNLRKGEKVYIEGSGEDARVVTR